MFLCGVEVEVSFSALFSNVLVAFATVKTTGARTQDCSITLSSIPVNINFYLNYLLTTKFYCHSPYIYIYCVQKCHIYSITLSINFGYEKAIKLTLGLKSFIYIITSMLLTIQSVSMSQQEFFTDDHSPPCFAV